MAMAKAVIAELDHLAIELRKVDIIEEKAYAIELGLRWAPAVAINGKIIFNVIPSKTELKDTLINLSTENY